MWFYNIEEKKPIALKKSAFKKVNDKLWVDKKKGTIWLESSNYKNVIYIKPFKEGLVDIYLRREQEAIKNEVDTNK